MSDEEDCRYAYMDLIDYMHEVGEALGGNKLYPCIEDLLKHEKCASTCGIVRVKVVLDEILLGSHYGVNDIEKEERKNKIEQLAREEREKRKDDS